MCSILFDNYFSSTFLGFFFFLSLSLLDFFLSAFFHFCIFFSRFLKCVYTQCTSTFALLWRITNVVRFTLVQHFYYKHVKLFPVCVECGPKHVWYIFNLLVLECCWTGRCETKMFSTPSGSIRICKTFDMHADGFDHAINDFLPSSHT